ncbi:hypothetical protein BpHYR1_045299 [Brachionus plicatilis]|uniref:Uncharacterized protein n=1 Tax=Brachionus plicatilis TaxID=10195 RepID=A0A3M7SNK5_BRAPC|nr:hypothetical protein BpHYR1_045299 [Brachionus plicatilis]
MWGRPISNEKILACNLSMKTSKFGLENGFKLPIINAISGTRIVFFFVAKSYDSFDLFFIMIIYCLRKEYNCVVDKFL